MAVGDIVRSGEGKLLEKDPKVARTVAERSHRTTPQHIAPHYISYLCSTLSITSFPLALLFLRRISTCAIYAALWSQAFWRGPDARDNDPLHGKRKTPLKKKPKIDYDAPLERVSALGRRDETRQTS